jgi:hypothetical protein
VKFQAKASTDFEICPAGNHVGICNAVIDLGLQPGRGQYPAPKHEVYVRFELPTERVSYQKDGKDIEGPMSIGRSFTASMNEKANLRKFVESWFGKKFPTDDAAASFDFANLLGRKCLLNVTHSEKGGKVYANINAATPIPKGMTADYPQHNKSMFFDLSAPDQMAYQALPEWLRKKIDGRLSEEAPAKDGGAPDERNPPPDDFGDESIPF